MNSFLADTARTTVDRRLWLQTTNKIETKAEATLKGQDKPVTIFNLDDFRNAQIDYPGSFATLSQASAKEKPSPDPHQLRAINDVVAGLRTSDRGQMIMACGTGKTFTTLWIKEALKAEKTLVLLPSLSLLSQTMREWAWAGNTSFEILNVCSDKSVGKKTEDMNPADAPFAVTSVVDEIAGFLKNSGPRVVFCTYQSSVLIAEAQRDLGVPPFDLAIADEAHRCAAGSADASFATILDGEKIKAVKRLFATATPKYFGRAIKDASKVNDFAVVDMNNKAVFGPVIHKLTFGQAIQDELLNDYQVVIVGVDEPMVKEWIDNQSIVATSPDEITDARTLAAKIAMLKAIKEYDLKRLISFHSSVLGAKKFSEEVVDVAYMIEPDNRPQGTFYSDYVSGNMKASNRKEKIEKLKALNSFNRGILSNARCLAEGVDVPSLDGVAFIDPKGSEIDIIQAVGRAIRKVRGAKVQTKGTIIVPVFIEEADDHETSIAASNFKPVWEVLKALRAHDTLLAEQLDQYRMNMGRGRNGNRETFGGRIIFDIPKTVDDGFVSAIRTVLVEATTSSWEFWFGLISHYKKLNGHCIVPQNALFQGHKLGTWTRQQRQRRKRKTISKERISRLDSLGFAWNVYEYQWDFMFEKLSLHYEKTKISLVAQRYDKSEPQSLGVWVQEVRLQFREDLLTPEQVAQFSRFHDWRWDFDDWDDVYNSTKHYCEKNNVTISQITDDVVANSGQNLKNWLNTQRSKGNNKQITTERIKLLEALPGWFWNARDKWLENYQAASLFAAKHQHLRVPRGKLNTWIKAQRKQRDQLSQRQQDLLNKLSGWSWDPFADAWAEGIKELKVFHREYGHLLVPQRFISNEGFKLGIWVNRTRIQHKNQKLAIERVTELESMESWVWEPLTYRWDEIYNRVMSIKHTDIDYKNSEIMPGIIVGNWLKSQKANINRLDASKRTLLAKL
jgi:superfamily II DNA or RNA helicase